MQAIPVAPVPAPTPEMRTRFVTAPLPKELIRRGLLAPSMIAHILASKYLLGVPFYRLEQQLALQGAPLDRGTMCRYVEESGSALGATVAHAMWQDALAPGAVISTDVTAG
jgi:transposase